MVWRVVACCCKLASYCALSFFYCNCSTVAGFMDITVNCIAFVSFTKRFFLVERSRLYKTCWNCLTSKIKFQPHLRWADPRSELWLVKVSKSFAEILWWSRLNSNKDVRTKLTICHFLLCQCCQKSQLGTVNSNHFYVFSNIIQRFHSIVVEIKQTSIVSQFTFTMVWPTSERLCKSKSSP